MLLLKKAPRICSTTAADCYQDPSAVLFLRFHTRNGWYKVCDQGNKTGIIFNCQKLVPGAESRYMSRPGLTWLDFAVVKPQLSQDQCKYWAAWLLSAQIKPPGLLLHDKKYLLLYLNLRWPGKSLIIPCGWTWANCSWELMREKANTKRRKQIIKIMPKRNLVDLRLRRMISGGVFWS